MSAYKCDAVVIGAGAGGEVVAKELGLAGLHVVLFDRGPNFAASDFRHNEVSDTQEPWNLPGLRFGPYTGEVQTYRSDPDKPWRVLTFSDPDYSSVARRVGGGTRSYQTLARRFQPGTFHLKSLYGVPTGSTLRDSAIGYDELEPYHEKAEYDVRICGEPGPYGQKRQKPYPMPPLPDNREAEVLFRAAKRLGRKPFHPPVTVLSQPFRG